MVNAQQFDHDQRAVGHDYMISIGRHLFIKLSLLYALKSYLHFFRYDTLHQPSSTIFQSLVREFRILRVLPPRHNVRNKYLPRHMVHLSPRIRFLQQQPERGVLLVRPVIGQQRELAPLLGLHALPAHHHPQCRRRRPRCSIHRQCLGAAIKPRGTALVL